MYSACEPFTKSKKEYKRKQKIREQEIQDIFIELDKACFEHVKAYEDFIDLPRKTASDKVLCDKAFNIAKYWKYDGYQHRLASMVYKFFDKKSSDVLLKMKLCQTSNYTNLLLESFI